MLSEHNDLPAPPGSFLPYERMLASSLKPFLRELTTIDAAVLVSYVCAERNAAIADIVTSSTEGLLKPGALRYGRHSSMEFNWGEQPALTLRMELTRDRLLALFNIVLHGRYLGIEILGIVHKEAVADAEDSLRLFASALADAALPRH
jgi:hypothetical protein